MFALPPVAGLLAAALSFAANATGPTQPVLIDETSRWGLLHAHQQRRETLTAVTDTLGAGACVLDYNLDGWMDLLLLTGSGEVRPHGQGSWWQVGRRSQRLYRNDHGLGFEDVTETALPDLPVWSMGCAVADLDGDGDPDLVLTGYQGTRLLQNDAGQQFHDMTAQAMLSSTRWTSGATIADFNGDGAPDIYLNGLVSYERNQRTFETLRGFTPTLPPAFDLALFDAQPNQLLQNLGQMQFKEVALQGALRDAAGRGLASRWVRRPQDAESWLQLFSAAQSPSHSLQQQDGRYAPSPLGYQTTEGLHYMDLGDLDGDGAVDALASKPEGNPLQLDAPDHAANDRRVWDLGMAQVSDLALTSWDVTFADWNLDGDLDIALANGRLTPDSDAYELPQGQPNTVRVYTPEGFQEASLPPPNRSSSRAAIRADFNNDGRSDLLFTNNNERPQLLINRTPMTHPWVGIVVVDDQGKTITPSVQIRLADADGVRYWLRHADQSFLSRHDPRALFTLRDEESAVAIDITWPDGRRSRHSGLVHNRYNIVSPSDTRVSDAVLQPLDTGERVSRYRRLGPLYLHLLIQSIDTQDHRTTQWLYTTLERDAEALQRVLRYFPPEPSPRLQAVIELGLRSGREETILAALEVAQQWESEQLLRLVDHLLLHTSDRVSCRAATVLQHFFAEEEAVIHSKYLAVPTLIKVFDAPSPEKARCALLALSEVEMNRGTNAIMRLAQSDDERTAVTALFTLGKRRQTTAVPLLTSIVQAPETSDARRTAAQDALFRLAHHNPSPVLASPLHRYAMLLAMTPSPGGITANEASPTSVVRDVDDPETNSLLELLAATSPSAEKGLLSLLSTASTSDILAVIDQLHRASQSRALRILHKVLRHPVEAVRLSALRASRAYLDDEKLTKRLWHLMRSESYTDADKAELAWILGTRYPQDVLTRLKS